ncbi:MAG: sugar ABC transporter permease, partial [Candidatus Dormiibacterota bacterium]
GPALSRARRALAASTTARAYLLNLPTLVVILALVAFPIGYSFWISLQRYNLKEPGLAGFIGFQNYVSLLSDQTFLASLRVSVEFSLIVVVFTVGLGVVLALVLNETFVGRGILRSLVLLPWAMPGVVNGLMWRWIFDPKVGVLNGALFSLGIIHSYRPWLISAGPALLLAAAAQVWNLVPFAVIILLSGLTTIPGELYDAARVDRAGVLQRFRRVTLPWIMHPLLIVLILETLNAFRSFDTVYILTGGGPGDATNLISLQTVQTVLTYTNFGLGDAYSYVIMAITLIVSLGYVLILYRGGSFET